MEYIITCLKNNRAQIQQPSTCCLLSKLRCQTYCDLVN